MINMDIYRIIKIMNKNPWGITIRIGENELYFPLAIAKEGNANTIEIYCGRCITSIPVCDIMNVSPGTVFLGKENNN